MGRKRENKQAGQEDRQEKRKAVLAALTKITDDRQLLEGHVSVPAELDNYYTLSREEMDALINGDMETLEKWVSNMDKNHATRLLRWLIKERW